jgi:outer membrane protein OmpA-like peptidoglycan-associated protein
VAQQAGDNALSATPAQAASADGRRLQLAAGGALDKLLMPPPRSPRRGLLVPPALVRVKPVLPAYVAEALGLETQPLPAPRESVTAAPLDPPPSEPAETIPAETIPDAPAEEIPEIASASAASDRAPLAEPVEHPATQEAATAAEAATAPVAMAAAEAAAAPEVASAPGAVAAPPPSAPQASKPQAPAPQAAAVDAMPDTPAAEATPAPQTAALPPLEGVRLLFAEGRADLSDAVKRDLGRFAEGLLQRDKQRIQLLAYAKGTEDSASQARRLSLSRALAVRGYLIEQGVLPTRMDVRALGNKADDDPRDRVDVELAQR